MAGDDGELRGELGDLLFQVYFLALLLEESGNGDLETVAREAHAKLVRRHPHVFGDAAYGSAEEVAAIHVGSRDADGTKRPPRLCAIPAAKPAVRRPRQPLTAPAVIALTRCRSSSE